MRFCPKIHHPWQYWTSLPIRLREFEIPFRAGLAAADCIGDPLRNRRQREAPVEPEAVAAEVLPGVLVKVEGVDSATVARFEVPQINVDPAKLRKIVRVSATGDDGLVAATCRGDRAKPGQAIGENGTAGSQVISGPGSYRLGIEASHRSDFGVDWVACLIHGNGCNDGNLILRSSTCHAARSFSAEVRIIHLDLFPEHVGILRLAHGPQNLVVK